MNTISFLFSYRYGFYPAWEPAPPFAYSENRLDGFPWRTLSFSLDRPAAGGLWTQRVQDWMKTMTSPQNRTPGLGERLSDAFRQRRYDDAERLLDDACQRGDVFPESLMTELEAMAGEAILLGRWLLARKAIDILESHRIDVTALRERLGRNTY